MVLIVPMDAAHPRGIIGGAMQDGPASTELTGVKKKIMCI